LCLRLPICHRGGILMLRALVFVTILSVAAWAQTATMPAPQSTAAAPASGGQVNAGTEFMAALNQPLSTKNSKVGDTFSATVQQNITGTNGAVVIPAGSLVQGQVTEAEQGKLLPELRGKG